MNTFWKDKTVLITGAASGIGLGLSKEMLARGAEVWLCDINADLENITKELNGKAHSLIFDVTRIEDFQQAVNKIVSTSGKIDLLFNNAGIGYGCDSVELTHKHYDRYIDINIRGVTNGISIVYPMMAKQGYGSIVNTASVGGLLPSAIMSPYAMTKHAVVGLSESLRLEAGYKGVNVITLCPGAVNTPIFDSTGPADLPEVNASNLRRFTREADTSCTPEEFAKNALNDIEQNKTLIIYPKLLRIAVWIYRHFPKLYLKITQPNLKQEMQRLSTTQQ